VAELQVAKLPMVRPSYLFFLPCVDFEQNLWWEAQQFFLMYLWRQYWYAKLRRKALQDMDPAMLVIRSSQSSDKPTAFNSTKSLFFVLETVLIDLLVDVEVFRTMAVVGGFLVVVE